MIRKSIIIPGAFNLEAGGSLNDLTVVYHTSNHERRSGEKVIFVCHGFTASSDAEDWWPGMVGPGKILDTDKYYIVCVNQIGSPYGTTSPLTVDPCTERQYLGTFPEVTIRDVARTFIAVCEAEGIDHMDLLVGASVGGYIAYELCVMAPSIVRHALLLATAPRVAPYITAYSEAQRMALEADQTFGRNVSPDDGKRGLESARAMGVISFRCFRGYELTQSEADDDTLFASRACSYERHQGEKFSARFNAYSFSTLLRTIDSHNIGRGRGGVEAVLRSIKVPCTIVAIDTDCLFPTSNLKSDAALIPCAAYYQITSSYGHDGFLLEYAQISEIIKKLI